MSADRTALPAHVERRLDELVGQHEVEDPSRARTALTNLLVHLSADNHAPSPVTAPEIAVDVHVADSLTGLLVPEIRSAERLADLGSGVGYPGLALAAVLPRTRVTLVESVQRKAEWLQRSVASAGLDNVEVVVARAETVGSGSERFDVVTARALAALPVLVEYAAPLLDVGGALVAWKAMPADQELTAGARAAREVGMEPQDALPVQPYAGSGRRTLQRFRKIAPTPVRFPRRPGMAAKRPLGS